MNGDNDILSTENVCCLHIKDRDEDLELLDNCFEEASNLSGAERSTVYYICGYVTFKENMPGHAPAELCIKSEFTELVSRGKLRYPPSYLFNLAMCLYTFFKSRGPGCCLQIF